MLIRMKRATTVSVMVALLVPTCAFSAGAKGMAAFKAGNYSAAIRMLRPEAEAGDPEAQLYLAYALRFSLPKSPGEYSANPSETDPAQQEIHRWIEKSAQQGYGQALYEYALDFDLGAGVAADFGQALAWMQKAFDQGERAAIEKLESWYDSGHIVAPSYAKFKELQALEREHNPDAAARTDKFVQIAKAASNYTRAADALLHPNDVAAAEAGDPDAAMRLGDAATYVEDPAKPDCVAAAKWYLRAGDAGNPDGYRKLAEQYYRGHCQQQDFARARELNTKAAEGGQIVAVYDLAEMHLFGHGLAAPDYETAYQWLGVLSTLDPNWLRHEPAMLTITRRNLSAEQMRALDARVAAQAPAIVAVRNRVREKITRREIKSNGDRSKPGEWSYALAMLDETGRCARNVREFCDHVPFRAVLEIRNPEPTTLACNFALVVQKLGDKEPTKYERRYILLPQDSMTPNFGFVAGHIDVENSGLNCERVAQPSLESGTCSIRPLPGTSFQDFIDKIPKKRRVAGRVTLGLIFSEQRGKPSEVVVKSSSGNTELDGAAQAYARATSFLANCFGPAIPMAMGVD
jgi:TPR repeat protein